MDTMLTTRRRLLAGALGAFALAGCGRQAARPAPPAARQFAGWTMGTTWRLTLAGERIDAALAERARVAVAAALDAVDRRMSLFRADSELSALNRHGAGPALPLSAELFDVLYAAQRVAELTGGSFDVTVAPLVQAWGFGTERRRAVPAAGVLQAQRRAVGHRGLQLDAGGHRARKEHATLQADLGGIAKGYGVDQAARALDALGVDNYLLEAGGELRARGRNAGGDPWQVGIERPAAGPRRPYFIVPMSRGAIATSGDYRSFFEQDGRRYSHEIDPARAAPIDHALCSVTVVADDCMLADALSTGLIVMGLERGYALAQRQGIAAHFIERSGGGLAERATPAFAALGGRRA